MAVLKAKRAASKMSRSEITGVRRGGNSRLRVAPKRSPPSKSLRSKSKTKSKTKTKKARKMASLRSRSRLGNHDDDYEQWKRNKRKTARRARKERERVEEMARRRGRRRRRDDSFDEGGGSGGDDDKDEYFASPTKADQSVEDFARSDELEMEREAFAKDSAVLQSLMHRGGFVNVDDAADDDYGEEKEVEVSRPRATRRSKAQGSHIPTIETSASAAAAYSIDVADELNPEVELTLREREDGKLRTTNGKGEQNDQGAAWQPPLPERPPPPLNSSISQELLASATDLGLVDGDDDDNDNYNEDHDDIEAVRRPRRRLHTVKRKQKTEPEKKKKKTKRRRGRRTLRDLEDDGFVSPMDDFYETKDSGEGAGFAPAPFSDFVDGREDAAKRDDHDDGFGSATRRTRRCCCFPQSRRAKGSAVGGWAPAPEAKTTTTRKTRNNARGGESGDSQR